MSGQWNSENPFVINPFYFANSTTTHYNQTWAALIHKWNNATAAILGLMSCLTVIYLAANKTPTNFKPYSRIILFCSCVDLYFLISDFVTQYRLKIVSGTVMFSVSGPISHLSYFWQCQSINLFTTSMVSAYLYLPFQFFYRYMTIKNGNPPSFCQITTYCTACFIILALSVLSTVLTYCTQNNKEGKEFAGLWYSEVPVPQLIFALESNIFTFTHCCYITFLGFMSYSFTIFYARRTVKLIRRKVFRMSHKTFMLQKQFGRALTAQALVPLFCAIGPILFATFNVAISRFDMILSSDIVMMSINWYPLFNSLCTLIFIAPYRHHCVKPLAKLYYKSIGINQSSVYAIQQPGLV